MKRIFLMLAVTALVVAMLAVGAGTALAAPGGNLNGKGGGQGGGDTINTKDDKAEKTRTGGGPLNNPHVNLCDICG